MPSKAKADKASGTSDIPTLLPLPRPIPLAECLPIKGVFCYVIEHYGHSGLSLLIHRAHGNVNMVVGDWDGNVIDLSHKEHPLHSSATKCLQDHSVRLYDILKVIGVSQAIFYLAFKDSGFKLVDVRLSLNKFVGPGMLRDVFGKIIDTQRVIAIDSLNPTIQDSIERGLEPFGPDIVLKPSMFRCAQAVPPIPLYAEVLR